MRKLSENRFDFEKLFDVVLAFNSENKYETLLDIILTKMMEITNSDGGTLYILQDNKLHFRIMKNFSLGIFQSENEIGLPPVELDAKNIKNICAYAAIKNQIVTIDDVYESGEFNFSGTKKYDEMTGYRTKSMLSLPLSAQWNDEQEILGVIQLLNAVDAKTAKIVPYGNVFHPPVIAAMANLAASTLANLMHMREIGLLFHSFVAVMTQAIDERSRYSGDHTQNVARLCNDFATYLGNRFPKEHKYHFNENKRERLTMAALLHDIGKTITPLNVMDKGDRLGDRLEGIKYRFDVKRLQLEVDYLRGIIADDEYVWLLSEVNKAEKLIEEINPPIFLTENLLRSVEQLDNLYYRDRNGNNVPLLDDYEKEALRIREGTLTAAERNIMREHVVITRRLLDKMTFWKYYKDVPEWAGAHHEFLDGSGYPNGLVGDEIPIGARIVSIIDIFEAIVAADRPYKKDFPASRALDVLTRMAKAGKLSLELVELFIDSKVWERYL